MDWIHAAEGRDQWVAVVMVMVMVMKLISCN